MSAPSLPVLAPVRPALASTGLRLGLVTARIHPERRPHLVAVGHERIAADLLRIYRHELAGGTGAVPVALNGNSFRSMTEELVAELAVGAPLDVVLLAYEKPDVHVPEVAGCYLSHACPGEPVAFSVSDQGVGAPFTALRIADAMCRDSASSAGALFVLDRAVLAGDESTDDSAVLLRFGGTGPTAVTAVTETVVTDPAVALAALVASASDATVVVGAGLAAVAPDGVAVAAARLGCTGPWAALARRWPVTGTVVLADHDPRAGRLFTCTLTGVGDE
jgi:hypothetical protein